MEKQGAMILIVEDNEENRDILKRRLAREGYRVDTANDGREGLTCLDNALYDLVILDIHMPVMDGVEVLKSMKSNATHADIPVIMLTAIEEMEIVLECMRSGACGYLTKPYSMDEVNSRIKECLASRP
jgi:DNA-binding response OmpR family regulator